MVGPDAGKKVGLQLKTDGVLVVFFLADAPLHGRHLVGDAEQVLHMVADLMGDDISDGKIAGGIVLVLQLLAEGEIDINLFVPGAVEGSCGRRAITAGGLDLVGVEHQGGHAVLRSSILKKSVPDIFGVF